MLVTQLDFLKVPQRVVTVGEPRCSDWPTQLAPLGELFDAITPDTVSVPENGNRLNRWMSGNKGPANHYLCGGSHLKALMSLLADTRPEVASATHFLILEDDTFRASHWNKGNFQLAIPKDTEILWLNNRVSRTNDQMYCNEFINQGLRKITPYFCGVGTDAYVIERNAAQRLVNHMLALTTGAGDIDLMFHAMCDRVAIPHWIKRYRNVCKDNGQEPESFKSYKLNTPLFTHMRGPSIRAFAKPSRQT